MKLRVLALPGDGIGKEVVHEAVRVLRRVTERFGHGLELQAGLVGGAAIEQTGEPLPGETLAKLLTAEAVLLGAVGLPEYDRQPPERRPEAGLLRLRQSMKVYANLRPVRVHPAAAAASPLKSHLVEGADLLIVRELTGGLYYGRPRGITGEGPAAEAVNTMRYGWGEIERVARLAFALAQRRRHKVTSVDKSNVLECSQLWRGVVTAIAGEFAGVTLEHMLVDNCAMQIVRDPRRFDVLLMENMFGDILSDEAAVIAGSIGMLPSASLGAVSPSGVRPGLYEPVHGSAPDIAGKGIANPIGAILSVAAMLEYTFGLGREAGAVSSAVARVLNAGLLTADMRPTARAATTAEVGEAVCAAIT